MQVEVERRNIKYILHFTKIENVGSIIENGLIPRSNLEVQGTELTFNDLYRHDGQKGASCLSISHPNYKMFYSLRQRDNTQKWVVVAFKRDVLWVKDCAFCHENAASNNVKAIPIQQRKGLAAFQKMFDPILGKPNRESLGLPEYCPTNPQAEVLVFGAIEPEYILGVITPDKQTETELKVLYPNVEFVFDEDFYRPRFDHEHW